MTSRVVGRRKIWQTLGIWRRSTDRNELLHPLSTLLTGMVFASHLVFSFCEMLQGAGRDQPKVWNPFCSTLWTGVRLTSLHTVILRCTMRCPMILSMIGRPSAKASGVSLFRENKESSWICGNSPQRGKRTSWPFHRRNVDHGWVSTGKLASVCWVQCKFDGAESLLCVQQLECKVGESQTDPTLWVKKALCSNVRFYTVVA